jgi:hypothetical protein
VGQDGDEAEGPGGGDEQRKGQQRPPDGSGPRLCIELPAGGDEHARHAEVDGCRREVDVLHEMAGTGDQEQDDRDDPCSPLPPGERAGDDQQPEAGNGCDRCGPGPHRQRDRVGPQVARPADGRERSGEQRDQPGGGDGGRNVPREAGAPTLSGERRGGIPGRLSRIGPAVCMPVRYRHTDPNTQRSYLPKKRSSQDQYRRSIHEARRGRRGYPGPATQALVGTSGSIWGASPMAAARGRSLHSGT